MKLQAILKMLQQDYEYLKRQGFVCPAVGLDGCGCTGRCLPRLRGAIIELERLIKQDEGPAQAEKDHG